MENHQPIKKKRYVCCVPLTEGAGALADGGRISAAGLPAVVEGGKRARMNFADTIGKYQ